MEIAAVKQTKAGWVLLAKERYIKLGGLNEHEAQMCAELCLDRNSIDASIEKAVDEDIASRAE